MKRLALLFLWQLVLLVNVGLKTVVVIGYWGWFVAPTYNIELPGFWQTAGIVMMVVFIVTKINFNSRKNIEKWSYEKHLKEMTRISRMTFILAAYLLLMGWVLSKVM